MPAANVAPWSAAVPDENAMAWRAPVTSQSAASKAGTRGPVVSQSERRASATAARSSSEICCFAYGSIDDRTGVPPSMASFEPVGPVDPNEEAATSEVPVMSRHRDAGLEPIGHPGAGPGKALAERDLGAPAEDLSGSACVAAQHGDLALGMDVLDVLDPRRLGFDGRRQLVDRDVLAGPRVEHEAGRGVAGERVADDAGAVRGEQEVARLGPVAVDPQGLAEYRAPGEDRDDPALAHRPLERPV